MDLTVKGIHLDVGDSLREHVRSNLKNAAEKYFNEAVEATAVFTKEKNHRYSAGISLHVKNGIVLESQFEADDPYPAFDQALTRMTSRLRKYKEKIRDHHRKDSPHDIHAAYTTFESNDNDGAEGGNEPAIIAETQTNIPTLAVSDAVMRLELGDLPALLFKNPGNGQLNMVYRRKDGNIGWVDPANAKQ